MIYIYRQSASQSARALVEALDQQGVGVRRLRSLQRLPGGGSTADSIVCWGESFHNGRLAGRILNGTRIASKFTDALRLRQAGVPTIEVSQDHPAHAPRVPVERFINVPGGRLTWEAARTLRDTLVAFVNTEVEYQDAPPYEWLARANSHVGGNDLLNPGHFAADYWVKKENIRREFRVHSFLGQSIRAGVKVHREVDFTPHEWIRSWQAGWRISYDGQTTRQRHRDLAANAVRALGLQFGAVDIGELPSGEAIVLEVNRAPGLEGGTIGAYATAILEWTNRD